VILDDFSRYIIAWKLCTTMKAGDVTDTLEMALKASGCDQETLSEISIRVCDVVRKGGRLLEEMVPRHGGDNRKAWGRSEWASRLTRPFCHLPNADDATEHSLGADSQCLVVSSTDKKLIPTEYIPLLEEMHSDGHDPQNSYKNLQRSRTLVKRANQFGFFDWLHNRAARFWARRKTLIDGSLSSMLFSFPNGLSGKIVVTVRRPMFRRCWAKPCAGCINADCVFRMSPTMPFGPVPPLTTSPARRP
jgi:hypothetical protein